MLNIGRPLPAAVVVVAGFGLGGTVRNIYARPRMIGFQVSVGAAR